MATAGPAGDGLGLGEGDGEGEGVAAADGEVCGEMLAVGLLLDVHAVESRATPPAAAITRHQTRIAEDLSSAAPHQIQEFGTGSRVATERPEHA